jgi:hypothetical protein
MESWATYLSMTGGTTARLVETAADARNREHLAAEQADARQSGQVRRWTRWKRPVVTVRPAAA